MRRVDARPCGPVYENWRERATAARNKMIEAWKAERDSAIQENRPVAFEPRINEDLYKELRRVFLFESFHRKCAYCEVNHSDGYPVQVEHYRPKGAVTENREPIDHPGYFWLAYEWWNLVPSCAHCNTNHTDPVGESHPGKKNEFPVGNARVKAPSDNPNQWLDELLGEAAILLNPYFDVPEQHIEFDPGTGTAISKSPRGEATISICDLRRPSLRDRRLSLRDHTVYGIVLDLMARKDKDIDSVVPPSSELSLWRKCLVRECLKDLCRRAGLHE